MHLGARQVQRLGDHRHRRVVDIAERVLHGVQDRQQGARLIAMGRDQPLKLGFLRKGAFLACNLSGRRGTSAAVGGAEIASSLVID